MHIPDGVLSVPVLVGGAVLTAGALVQGLRSLDEKRLPRVAVISSMFFVASLVSIPLGPTSVHLLLSGLMGLILGWAIFPAVFIALMLQSVFFGFGGLAAIGINTFNVAFPGLVLATLARPLLSRISGPVQLGAGVAVIGGLAVVMTTAQVVLALVLSDPAYFVSAQIAVIGNIPLMIIETIIAGFIAGFISQVKPDLFSFLVEPRRAN